MIELFLILFFVVVPGVLLFMKLPSKVRIGLGFVIAVVAVTGVGIARADTAYLVRSEAAPGGGYYCYYSNGYVYGPVQSCPSRL